jgi:hypothetical protein
MALHGSHILPWVHNEEPPPVQHEPGLALAANLAAAIASIPSKSRRNAADLQVVDPVQYPGWNDMVARHPETSFFHTSAWAQVLRGTYGHAPVYICRIANNRLEGLLPMIEVAGTWTGRRGVSLPFIDFCSPLAGSQPERQELYASAVKLGQQRGWKYIECRGGTQVWTGASPSSVFHSHVLDLVSDTKALFEKLDDSMRRGIRKAGKEGVRVEFSNGSEAVRQFYALHCQTRRRHGLPPQPFRFFENIARHVIEPGHGWIGLARLKDRPVAAAVFFHYGKNALFKYGASDYAFQQLRPNNLLMWEAIRWYAERGFNSIHLGRTELAHEGLRRFKLGFGAREDRIEYCRYDLRRRAFVTSADRTEGWFNHLFRRLPLRLLRLAGETLYPHLS